MAQPDACRAARRSEFAVLAGRLFDRAPASGANLPRLWEMRRGITGSEGGDCVGKDQNTYAKRQREMNKKRKAEDKRARRQKRKEQAHSTGEQDVADRSTPE
jgi:hypothetical protein